jgi:DNA-binding CsgD family transcriptional regulator
MDEKPWLESLVACLSEGVAFVRPNWKILWASRAFSAALGLEGGAKGLDLEPFVEGFDAFREEAEGALESDERVVRNARLIRQDGDAFDATVSLSTCADGLTAAWAISIQPAGELESLRRELALRERSHSFLMAATSDVIVRVDEDLVATWVNEAAGEFLKLGEPLAKALTRESLATLAEMVDDPDLPRDRKTPIELESARDRSPWFLLRGYLRRLTDDEGAPTGASLVLRDDSHSRRVDAAAAKLGLSPREKVVVEYLLQGYSNLNIAAILGLSESGVKFHVRNIFARAKVSSRTELLATLLSE